ncbi:unnamed protein product, partial [Didymodactylos carnosus]
MSSSSKSQLEQLPNELLIIVLKHLSIYNLYKDFFGLNQRFNYLIKCVTPRTIDKQKVNEDSKSIRYESPSNRLCIDECVTCFLLPRLNRDRRNIDWLFFNELQHTATTVISVTDQRRLLAILKKYSLKLNLLLFYSYTFIVKADQIKFKGWTLENYPLEYVIIKDFDFSQRTHDWNENIRGALS